MTTRAFVDRCLEVAAGEVGIREKGGNNRGPVEKYLAAVVRPPGDAYCTAFVVWVGDRAAADLGLEFNPMPRTAGAQKFYSRSPEWARLGQKPFMNPLEFVGCLGVMDTGKGQGHVFFVEGFDGKQFVTIEGNTSDTPDPEDPHAREGQGVCRRTRPLTAANMGWLLFDMSRALEIKRRHRIP